MYVLSVPFNISIRLQSTAFSLFHHSVQLFFLPLTNRPADAEPGTHSKTAGVPVSQLINTQNYLPASTPKPHFILFKHSHRKTERENQFPIIALLNIHLLPFCNHKVGIIGLEMSSKITRTTQKRIRNFGDNPPHL